jgi:putative phosphoribosyl transferase
MSEFVEDSALRGRKHVFQDRRDAGRLLAGKLTHYKDTGALIPAIPSGCLPVAERTVKKILTETDEVICLNVRSSSSFAVADAYRNWYDLTDEDVLTIIEKQRHT